MDLDFRELEVELWWTVDGDQMKERARTLKKKHRRRAGRKKKFTPKNVQNISYMIENGMTVDEVAKQFQTSRQVIGRYINEKPS